MSKSSGGPTQRAHQERALAMLANRGMKVEELDGFDSSNSERRDELVKISKKKGVYPQIFMVKDGTTTFLGDYDWIENANENGQLTKKDLFGEAAAVVGASEAFPR